MFAFDFLILLYIIILTTSFNEMKTSQIVILVLCIAVAAIFTSIYFAVAANFYNIQFFLLIAIQSLGIYALLGLKGEAQRRENKTNNNNGVSQ
ncbi:hypothetical protein JV174_24770 [Pseudomonas sp. SDM007_2]|nr:hypothetical protein [Pseudomonas hygromyciniae]MBN0980429.1 hypothetical protein [Pseudomonas hygromyciniae]